MTDYIFYFRCFDIAVDYFLFFLCLFCIKPATCVEQIIQHPMQYLQKHEEYTYSAKFLLNQITHYLLAKLKHSSSLRYVKYINASDFVIVCCNALRSTSRDDDCELWIFGRSKGQVSTRSTSAAE